MPNCSPFASHTICFFQHSEKIARCFFYFIQRLKISFFCDQMCFTGVLLIGYIWAGHDIDVNSGDSALLAGVAGGLNGYVSFLV